MAKHLVSGTIVIRKGDIQTIDLDGTIVRFSDENVSTDVGNNHERGYHFNVTFPPPSMRHPAVHSARMVFGDDDGRLELLTVTTAIHDLASTAYSLYAIE